MESDSEDSNDNIALMVRNEYRSNAYCLSNLDGMTISDVDRMLEQFHGVGWGLDFYEDILYDKPFSCKCLVNRMFRFNPSYLILNGFSASSELVDAICEGLAPSHKVYRLVLSATSFRPGDLHRVFNTLCSPTFSVMEFLMINLSPSVFHTLLRSPTTFNLTHLILCRCSLGQNGFDLAAEHFRDNPRPNLLYLKLSGNGIKNLQSLGILVAGLPQLGVLDLSNNPLSDTRNKDILLSSHTAIHEKIFEIKIFGTSIRHLQPNVDQWLAFKLRKDVNLVMAFASMRIHRLATQSPMKKLFRDFDRLLGSFLISKNGS